MNRLPIRQQNHTQVSTFHLRDLNPPADTAISLNVFSNRLSDRVLDPLAVNHRTIGAPANRLEIGGDLHRFTLTERDRNPQAGDFLRTCEHWRAWQDSNLRPPA